MRALIKLRRTFGARLAALARYRKKKALRALRPRSELQRYKSRHTIASKRPRVADECPGRMLLGLWVDVEFGLLRSDACYAEAALDAFTDRHANPPP